MKNLPLLAAAAAFSLLSSNALALTVTAVTSDNGYPAHLVQWTDSDGLPRSAMMVDQNSTGSGPFTGYLRQYTYQFGGKPRVCTGTDNVATGGNLETSGDGFIQNHTADGGDYSTGNGMGFAGSTAITLNGASHAIITYSIPGYAIGASTVPSTVSWFFADGRSHPVFSISQDARATPGNLGADNRSPYGDMAYDGDGVDALVGGFSYGDTFKFVTTASAPEEVTNASGWSDTAANTIPYAMQWAEPATIDAEMGHVATLPITISDQGSDTRTSAFNNPPDLFDPRTMSKPAGPLPPIAAFAYQTIEYSLSGNNPTDSKRLTWGTNFGRVGGFDNYGDTTLDVTQYSHHFDDPLNNPLAGTRASGLLNAYSVFVVFGPHSGNYLTGAVGKTVDQMANSNVGMFTASVGAVATSGPAGVGVASNATIAYTPGGYNPTYAAWEIAADGNAANFTLTPDLATTLDHPVFVVTNYTSPALPTQISVNGSAVAGTDYFASVDHAAHRLWITVNQAASSPVTVQVVAPPPSTTPTVTATAKGDGSATEGGGNGKIVLTRMGDDESSDLSVSFKLRGSAKNGVDYQMVSTTAVIPAGSASVKVKIKPIDDDIQNGTRVAKLKIIDDGSGDYLIGSPSKASITIFDND